MSPRPAGDGPLLSLGGGGYTAEEGEAREQSPPAAGLPEDIRALAEHPSAVSAEESCRFSTCDLDGDVSQEGGAKEQRAESERETIDTIRL